MYFSIQRNILYDPAIIGFKMSPSQSFTKHISLLTTRLVKLLMPYLVLSEMAYEKQSPL